MLPNDDEEGFEGMEDYDEGREAPEIDPDDYDDFIAGRRDFLDDDDSIWDDNEDADDLAGRD